MREVVSYPRGTLDWTLLASFYLLFSVLSLLMAQHCPRVQVGSTHCLPNLESFGNYLVLVTGAAIRFLFLLFTALYEHILAQQGHYEPYPDAHFSRTIAIASTFSGQDLSYCWEHFISCDYNSSQLFK